MASIKQIIKKLLKQKAENVSFKDNQIKLKFDGKVLVSKIIIFNSRNSVACWDSKRPIIKLHEKYHPNNDEKITICIHELVEKYCFQKLKLPMIYAHNIANVIEKKWLVGKTGKKNAYAAYQRRWIAPYRKYVTDSAPYYNYDINKEK